MNIKEKGQQPESRNPNFKSSCKDTKSIKQKTIVYNAFNSDIPKTMLQVSEETNIRRANICRYVAEFRKQDNIQLLQKGICPISIHRAGFYTTNTELFINVNQQLRMFDNE